MAAIRPLCAELQKIANEELNEVESRIPADLAALREWIGKQPHLRARTDDQFLIAFLRSSKHSLDKAKSKIEHFYTIRQLVPAIFADNRLDEVNLKTCRSGAYVQLPKTLGGPGGPIIYVSRYKLFQTHDIPTKDGFRYVALLLDQSLMYDDNLMVSGYTEILDMSGVGLSALARLEPIMAKQWSTYFKKAISLRIKALHIINAAKEAHASINVIRSLVPDKVKDRFYSHKSIESLCEHIPLEYLPIEYGGQNGSLAELPAEVEQRLLERKQYTDEMTKYGVDESLRLGPRVDSNSMFGIEGTFRKLDID